MLNEVPVLITEHTASLLSRHAHFCGIQPGQGIDGRWKFVDVMGWRRSVGNMGMGQGFNYGFLRELPRLYITYYRYRSFQSTVARWPC